MTQLRVCPPWLRAQSSDVNGTRKQAFTATAAPPRLATPPAFGLDRKDHQHDTNSSRRFRSKGKISTVPTTPAIDIKLPPKRLLGRLWRSYLKRHSPLMALAFLIMVIEGSTLGALSYMLKPLFDKVFSGTAPQGALLAVGFGILALFVIRATTSIISKTLMASISLRIATAMQVDLLRHVLTLDGAFFQDNPPGALINRVQGDTGAIQGIWSTLLMGVGRDLVALLSLLAVTLSIDVTWTLAALIGAPLLILPAVFVQRYIRSKAMLSREQAGQRATRLDEIFHGIQAVKLNSMEDYQTGRFHAIVNKIRRVEVRATAGRSAMPALIDVVTGIGFFAVLMLGGREVAAGTRTVGEFMAFFTAMSLTFQPIRRLGDLSGLWQTAAVSLERVYWLFDSKPALRPASLPHAPFDHAPSITLQDVHFDYGPAPVLRGLSFTAQAGKITALVGASGAGKTTVFHLLTGLLQPTSGSILIDNTDTSTLDLSDLRAVFASVSQDTALFDETLRENVLLGKTEVPDALLQSVLDAAHVTDFSSKLPAGLDTPAGPRGSGLSGGQRQRVAIARALLRDAPVLLLDEATSALDAKSEALVADALSRLRAGRTTLVIAHRLSTVREADLIVVMDKGCVVEQGRHDDLVAKGGLYAQLYKLQFKEKSDQTGTSE
jgi:ATP-binding cassette, subfamily B, bacterial MsbA